MIPYQEIKKLVRFKLKDNNELTYSDYEIKMAVNEVIRYLSVSQALNNSDFLNKGFSFDEGHDHTNYRVCGVELPKDFVALVGVTDYRGRMLEPCDSMEIPRHYQYKISGNRLFCGAHAFNMMYKSALTEIEDDEDCIELPRVFLDTITKLTMMILEQADTDIMHAAADADMNELIPRRRYRNVRIKLPFKIGGRI